MLLVAVCVCFVACVLGAPAPTDVVPLEKQQPTVIPIISQSDELEANGTYHFSYETGNGIKREEISYDKKVPKAKGRSAESNEGGEDSESDSDEIHVQMGSYSYTAPDGTLISVRYIADENGFQPIGDHIPRVPSATGSGEKSGRALKGADNEESASAPKAAIKSAKKLEPASASPPAGTGPKTAENPNEASTTAPEEGEVSTKPGADSSTTEGSKAPEEASTTESSSTGTSTTAGESTNAATSTTEASSTPTSDASTPGGNASTSAVDASTSSGDSSTPAGNVSTSADASTPANDASSPAAEQSTTNAESSTTEATSTTAA